MRLHGRDSYVVILIPETADLLGLRKVAGLVITVCSLAVVATQGGHMRTQELNVDSFELG